MRNLRIRPLGLAVASLLAASCQAGDRAAGPGTPLQAPAPTAAGAPRFHLAAAPSNDDLADAAEIPTIPFEASVDMSEATAEPDEPPACGFGVSQTVWYRYTPTADAQLVITTAGSLGLTSWSAYTGAPGALTQVACAESSSRSPTALVDVHAGETLYIQANVIFLAEGTPLVLAVRPPAPAPANDDIDGALPIAPLPFSHTTDDFVNVTVGADDPTDCNVGQDPSVWYRYTNGGTTPARVAFGFRGFFTNLDVYAGPRGALDKLICNTPFYPVQGFTIEFRPGESVYAAITQIFGDLGPATILAAEAPAGPPNDGFDAARPLVLGNPADVVDFRNASLALDDPRSCLAVTRLPQSAWWTYTAAADREVEVVAGGVFTALLQVGVFTGERGALRPIACGDRSAHFQARAGQTYRIMVGALGGGDIGVRAQAFVPLAADVLVDPVATLDRRTNRLTVTGQMVTNKEATVFACGQAIQRAGKTTLLTDQLCAGETFVAAREPWSQTVACPNGILTAGNATVQLQGEARTPAGEAVTIKVSAPVRVKAVR